MSSSQSCHHFPFSSQLRYAMADLSYQTSLFGSPWISLEDISWPSLRPVRQKFHPAHRWRLVWTRPGLLNATSAISRNLCIVWTVVTKAKSPFVSVVPPTSCTALSISATTKDEYIGRIRFCGCDGKFQARRLDNDLIHLSSLKCEPINWKEKSRIRTYDNDHGPCLSACLH